MAKVEMSKSLEAKTARIIALEAEMSHLKTKLADETNNHLDANHRLEKAEFNLHETSNALKTAESRSANLASQIESQKAIAEETTGKMEDMKKKFDKANEDHDRMILQLDQVILERDNLKQKVQLLEKEEKEARDEAEKLEAALKKSEDTFGERVEKTKVVQELRKALQSAEDELSDKRKARKKYFLCII